MADSKFTNTIGLISSPGDILRAAARVLDIAEMERQKRASTQPQQCRFAQQCSEEGSCVNECADRAPVAHLRSTTQPDWLEVCQKGEPGAFPVWAGYQTRSDLNDPDGRLQVLADSIKRLGLEVFDGPECPQGVRDAIEWFAAELSVSQLPLAAAPGAPSLVPDLHAAIIKLPMKEDVAEPDDGSDLAWVVGYKTGHREARHAAAELVSSFAAPSLVPAEPTPESRMFMAAVRSIAEISRALGIPDEEASVANGNELILEKIAELIDSGECRSCVDGKCTTGAECVTLGRDAAPGTAAPSVPQPLTNEQIHAIADLGSMPLNPDGVLCRFARAIERAHGIGGSAVQAEGGKQP